MSLRCGCSAEGDDIVFGPVHECSKDPDLNYRKSRNLWGLAGYPYEAVLDEQERTGD
jgi:hypothetical protein